MRFSVAVTSLSRLQLWILNNWTSWVWCVVLWNLGSKLLKTIVFFLMEQNQIHGFLQDSVSPGLNQVECRSVGSDFTAVMRIYQSSFPRGVHILRCLLSETIPACPNTSVDSDSSSARRCTVTDAVSTPSGHERNPWRSNSNKPGFSSPVRPLRPGDSPGTASAANTSSQTWRRLIKRGPGCGGLRPRNRLPALVLSQESQVRSLVPIIFSH